MLHTACAVLGLLFRSVVLENWFQNGDDMSRRNINQKVKSCLKSSRSLKLWTSLSVDFLIYCGRIRPWLCYVWLSFFLILSCVAWKVNQTFLCGDKVFLQFWWPESLAKSSHLLAWSKRVRCAALKYSIKVTRRGAVDGEGIDSTTVATTAVPRSGCKNTVCQNCLLGT